MKFTLNNTINESPRSKLRGSFFYSLRDSQFSSLQNKKQALALLPFVVILLFALTHRIKFFDRTSKDNNAHEEAILDLFEGRNPYERTVRSYESDDIGGHGYAYLPGLLYLNGGLYLFYLLLGLPLTILWKIPILIADILIGVLLAKEIYKTPYLHQGRLGRFVSKASSSYLFALVGFATWFLNPFSIARQGYTYSGPLAILFMFLALLYLEKDEVISGASLSLSIIFKTFPIILLPIFLIKSKDKVKFILAVLIVGVFFSIPFMTSVSDFLTYLQGSLLVHSERVLQGRPFLFYISYYYDIEFFQIIPLKVYGVASIFLGWILIPIAYYLLKIKDKYILGVLAFLNFYILTPVLNRTYLMWFIPILVMASVKLGKNKKYLFFVVLAVYYIFYYWYLVQWEDGFHVWHP